MRRPKIPFANVVIARTKDVASSTKVWVQTGAVVNKVITTGWSWSDVGARLLLHIDRSPDFRFAIHRICVVALGIICLYSVALGAFSYYLGRRKCRSLRAEVVQLTERLREADGRQLRANAMILYLLERASEDGSDAAPAAVAAAIALYEETMAGIGGACFEDGSLVTISGKDCMLLGHLASPKRDVTDYGRRFGGERRDVKTQNGATLEEMEDSLLGRGGSVTSGADYLSEHLVSPERAATGYGHRFRGSHRDVSRKEDTTLEGVEDACFGEESSGSVSSGEDCMLKRLPPPGRGAIGHSHRFAGERREGVRTECWLSTFGCSNRSKTPPRCLFLKWLLVG